MADNIKKFVDVTLLTKDIKKLAEFIEYSGPRPAHLGFIAIRVKDPDGNHISFYQVPKEKNKQNI
ncbi:hypothetical protein KAW55_04870 [bacterium]|nr:hypothetical protein [bacterium]